MKKIFFFIYIIWFYAGPGSAGQYYVQRYTVNEGLSDNFVNHIFQDSFGYLWISTSYGLDRYDGYSFENFFYGSPAGKSLCSNFVNHVQEDEEHNLWVSTDAGVSCFNYSTQSAEQIRFSDDGVYFVHKTLNSAGLLYAATDRGIVVYNKKSRTSFLLELDSLTHKSVHDIAIDREGKLWFTQNENACSYDLTSKRLTCYPTEKNVHYINDELWLKVLTGPDGTLWLATANGLLEYDRSSDRFHKIVDTEGNIGIAIQDSLIWIANWESGLIRYNRHTGRKEYLSPSGTDKESPDFSPLVCVFVDKDQVIWTGGGKGIAKYVSRNEMIRHYGVGVPSPRSSSLLVKTVLEDSKGNLWAGTEDGLRKIDRYTGKVEVYKSVTGISQEKLNNQVLSLCEDRKGRLWVGTLSGLNVLNPCRKNYEYYSTSAADSYLNSNQIWNMRKDGAGNFWIGTRMGLFCFNPDTRKFESFFSEKEDSNTIGDNRVMTVWPDGDTIYAGTKNGICRIDDFRQIKRYECRQDDGHSPVANVVNQLLKDKKGRIWLFTDLGLYRFMPEREKLEPVPSLLRKRMLAGVEDESGRLWAVSNNEIYIFDPDTGGLRLLNDMTEMKNSYTSAVPYRNADGELFFGKINGICAVSPEKLSFRPDIPSVNLSSFHLFARELLPGEKDSPLKTHINQTRELRMNYRQNFFSIQYEAIGFHIPFALNYAYMLEGFDKEWIRAGDRRTAYYTKVPPGDYLFRVKALDNTGQWEGPEKSFRIVIDPPFYNTVYAYVVYGCLILLLLYFFRRYTIIQVIEKSKLEKSMMEQQKEREMYDAKVRFFMNVSHEFRTPLTLILEPAQHLLDMEGSLSKRAYLMSVLKNTRRLLSLVNQLLEFRKAETGTLQLRVSENDVEKCVSEILHTFDEVASGKQISLQLQTEKMDCPVWFDVDMFEKILFNLLTNALKFTPPGGTITLTVVPATEEYIRVQKRWRIFSEEETVSRQVVRISVQDTGIGIPEDKLERVFDRFYQVSSAPRSEGTGIGLSLVKDLVTLHQGTIRVTSVSGQGTCFTFTLPLGHHHFQEAQLVEYPMNEYVPQIDPNDIFTPDAEKTVTDPDPVELPPDVNRPIVLVVEDNKEIIMYIRNSLQLHYEVITACQGQDGLEKAIRTMPNIILCDINMPVMDGMELTSRLKKNELTNHIPVILLTAYASDELQLEAYSCGADDYMTKPFNIKLLEVKINNILRHEKEIRQKFRQQAIYENVMGEENAHSDDAFFVALNKFLEEHVTNPELDVDFIAKGLFISRSQLYRKVSALSGFSVKEYVKLFRLKMAESLLAQKEMRISEVMDSVGFNNRSYFITSFKKVYNMTPSEYKNLKCRGEEI